MDDLGENPIFSIDDSDVIKPLEIKFEDLGIEKIVKILNKRGEKMLCKCNKSSNNSKKTMNKFNTSI